MAIPAPRVRRENQLHGFIAPPSRCCLIRVLSSSDSSLRSRSVVSDSLRPHGLEPTRLQSMRFSRREYWSGLPFPSEPNSLCGSRRPSCRPNREEAEVGKDCKRTQDGLTVKAGGKAS